MRRIAIMLLALLLCAVALAEETEMKDDFSTFTNVTLKGIDTSTLNEDARPRCTRPPATARP